MKSRRFNEYLNSKKKMDKVVVSVDADRTDPMTMPNKPPKGGKPYGPAKGKKSSKQPFGEMGDKKLVYKPDIKHSDGAKPAKIPTVRQVEIASAVADAVELDPTLIETIVTHIKRKGFLGALVAEVLDHKDTFQHMSEIMTHESYGPDICRKLATAMMNEEVAKPFSDQLDSDDEDEDEEDDGFDTSDDGDEEEDIEDDDEDEEDEESEEMDPAMMGDPSMMGMDPNAMNMDPSMMGMDPSMMGMDPSMMGGMPPMNMPPAVNPLMGVPQMKKFFRK